MVRAASLMKKVVNFWYKTLLQKTHECDYICFNVKEACLLVTNIAWHINFHIALSVPF
jgi:hypothetical protein